MKKNVSAILVSFTSLVFLHTTAVAQTKNLMIEKINIADSAKGITIHQSAYFKVTPVQVYKLLLSSAAFSACTKKSFDMFSASSAKIDSVSSAVSFLYSTGISSDASLNWNPVNGLWKHGVSWTGRRECGSVARFDLNAENGGTRLIFEHVGFPEGLKEHLSIGWQQHYWDAMTKYFQ